jgi:DNA-binding response OmpR family regulator
MQIIVASRNIFRRELSSYVLSEARYLVHEVASIGELVAQLGQVNPLLLVIDIGLGENVTDLLRQVCAPSAVPILWLRSDPDAPLPLQSDAHVLDWPFRHDELIQRVGRIVDMSMAHERAVS